MDFQIGCSGWSYKHWRGDFYPAGLPMRLWFQHYATQFATVELNTTFYRLPKESTVEKWAADAPPGFTFAIKVSQLVTHFRRLRNCEEELATFFERMAPLRSHLGAYLYQLPVTLKRDDAVLRDFLKLLPAEAVHAFEFRDESWWHDDVYELLSQHHATFVLYDMADTRTPVVATGEDVYMRFHGPTKYSSSYSRQALAAWCAAIKQLPAKRALVFFNNDIGGHAPRNARTLTELVTGR